MAFMQISIGAVAIGVILFIGYLLVAQIRVLMPSDAEIGDANFTESLASTQGTVLAGFGLVGVGIIVLAAFGLITLWK